MRCHSKSHGKWKVFVSTDICVDGYLVYSIACEGVEGKERRLVVRIYKLNKYTDQAY